MKPPPFRYHRAETLDHALAVLAAEGEGAKLLAGGQSLMPLLNFRLLHPAVLVDINPVHGLAEIAETATGLRIGALARHAAVAETPAIARHFPLIVAAMAELGHPAIRNRGTIGGSLAQADPAAEWPLLAVLLQARILTRSPRGAGAYAAARFFVSALTTALAADEIITAVEFPYLAPGAGWGFAELARRHGDFALAAVGVTLAAAAGRARGVRIAMLGGSDVPCRAEAAEAILEGEPPTPARLADAIAAVREAADPASDLHASAAYRRELIGVLAGRAITDSWRRAGMA